MVGFLMPGFDRKEAARTKTKKSRNQDEHNSSPTKDTSWKEHDETLNEQHDRSKNTPHQHPENNGARRPAPVTMPHFGTNNGARRRRRAPTFAGACTRCLI
ncbi:hypothetical protein [Bifidobacterium samirii]|uniref:hypothetical protein n=1 Tax=Bifidobacterium samirii TaxID=2306974 RepID=UPI0013DF590C|nr:hypothetical protein [Bifidobacterium samirii]